MRHLFVEFPELTESVAHQELASLPTPVQRLSVGNNNWIKRDDLTHPTYGGNKIRKLEFIVADALARGKRRIVTFGATGTNHGVATAMVCQQLGLKCRIYLFGQPVTNVVRQNLRLMRAFNADLRYVGSLARTVLTFYSSPSRALKENYFLFAGGSNELGALGFVNAALELRQQIENGQVPQPRIIVCPVGSGATLAGLTLGMTIAQLPIEVRGVRVAPSHLGLLPACTQQTVHKLMFKTRRLLSERLKAPLPELKSPILLDDFFGLGYGEPTPEAQSAAEVFAQAGIGLESTYTAKTAAAFMSIAHSTEGPALFWHTFNSRNMNQIADEANVDELAFPLRSIFLDSATNILALPRLQSLPSMVL